MKPMPEIRDELPKRWDHSREGMQTKWVRLVELTQQNRGKWVLLRTFRPMSEQPQGPKPDDVRYTANSVNDAHVFAYKLRQKFSAWNVTFKSVRTGPNTAEVWGRCPQ